MENWLSSFDFNKGKRGYKYGSCLPMIKSVLDFFGKEKVIECGSGFFSTKLFLEMSGGLVSIEHDFDFSKIVLENVVFSQNDQYIVRTLKSIRRDERYESVMSFYEDVFSKNRDCSILFVDTVGSIRGSILIDFYHMFDIVIFHDSDSKKYLNFINNSDLSSYFSFTDSPDRFPDTRCFIRKEKFKNENDRIYFSEKIKKNSILYSSFSKKQIFYSKVEKFNNMNKIVSFYTKDTGYEEEVHEKLIPSLKRFGLDYSIEGLESAGSWVENCSLKSGYIRRKMNEFPDKNIIWIDADAVINSFPGLFMNIDEDISARYRKGDYARLMSGTVFIKNNEKARTTVDIWVNIQKKDRRMWDQKCLEKAIEKCKHDIDLRVLDLPVRYCRVFDREGDTEAVIEHFQASRRFKRTINESKKQPERILGKIDKNIYEVEGFFSKEQMEIYGEMVSHINNGIIIEVGSYAGRSALSILDICKKNNNKIYCVDTWKGSSEHQVGKDCCVVDPQYLFSKFNENISLFNGNDIIIPIKLESLDAVDFFMQKNIKADLVFIDADHGYRSVCRDITGWNRVLKDGGILSGHDIDFSSVKKAVDECIVNYSTSDTIWYTDSAIDCDEKFVFFVGFDYYNHHFSNRFVNIIHSFKKYTNCKIVFYKNYKEMVKHVGGERYSNSICFMKEGCITGNESLLSDYPVRFGYGIVYVHLGDESCPLSGKLDLLKKSISCFFVLLNNVNDHFPKWVKDRTVVGYGFVPECGPMENIICFIDKNKKIIFTGSVTGNTNNVNKNHRYIMMKAMKDRVPDLIDFNITKFERKKINKEKFFTDTSAKRTRRKEYIEYLKEIDSSKYSLCPFGNGRGSYRFLESMSVGSIPISNDIDDFNMIGDFKNGFNYLSVGKGYENIENIIHLICSDSEELEEISRNGKKTYEKWFRINGDGSFQIDLFLEFLKRINAKTNNFFEEEIFTIEKNKKAHFSIEQSLFR